MAGSAVRMQFAGLVIDVAAQPARASPAQDSRNILHHVAHDWSGWRVASLPWMCPRPGRRRPTRTCWSPPVRRWADAGAAGCPAERTGRRAAGQPRLRIAGREGRADCLRRAAGFVRRGADGHARPAGVDAKCGRWAMAACTTAPGIDQGVDAAEAARPGEPAAAVPAPAGRGRGPAAAGFHLGAGADRRDREPGRTWRGPFAAVGLGAGPVQSVTAVAEQMGALVVACRWAPRGGRDQPAPAGRAAAVRDQLRRPRRPAAVHARPRTRPRGLRAGGRSRTPEEMAQEFSGELLAPARQLHADLKAAPITPARLLQLKASG